MKYLIITTINDSSAGSFVKLREALSDWEIVVVGDRKTPEGWALPGVRYISVEEQMEIFPSLSKNIPLNSYSRKNIGYAYAIKNGAKIIAETDDDNYPYSNFLADISEYRDGFSVNTSEKWINVYRFFAKQEIWPRGFSLNHIANSWDSIDAAILEPTNSRALVQQYLADGDTDVDAIYRLTSNKDVKFKKGLSVFLENGQICPFNSQNTVWFSDAFPLLYLPSFVSFRMTDIWRSFVAQICLYKVGEKISFSSPTLFQERNEHNLSLDFEQEVPGYLNNDKIIEVLCKLDLQDGVDSMQNNLFSCYKGLHQELGIVTSEELDLLSLWFEAIGE